MIIAICSNLKNGIGLQADYELLKDFLEKNGHEVFGVQFTQSSSEVRADLCIWLEVVNAQLIGIAPRHWLIANPEWLKPEFEQTIFTHFEKVLAKTKEAYNALQKKFPNVHYVGSLTKDRRDLSVPREDKFLHIGGNGGFRNTNAVIEAWRSYRYYNGLEALDAPLTIISNSSTTNFQPTPGVTFLKRVTEEELVRLQNSHLFHLYPSAYEGWGQALHEAQSVAAIVLTTDAAPMNEFGCPFLVPSVDSRKKNNLGVLHDVSPADIRGEVHKMLSQYNTERARMTMNARLQFEKSNKDFADKFLPLLQTRAKRQDKFTIAILGNHGVSFSTESELAWSLEDMGHRVIKFQENSSDTEEIFRRCVNEGVRLLIYVHTHGWSTPGLLSVDELIKGLRKEGIKTASFHLDRYVGLNKSDGRESRVGSHPFWKTDVVFTADGGNQNFFISKGIRHVWLPPAVVKKWCISGKVNGDLSIDVGFVGARGYHPEYPFRAQLIDFLENMYGERFKVFSGFREQSLNDLYASIRVVVGDSCFGGSPFYWSDRVPETLGRGGFLLHPASEGLTIPGLVTYNPGDLTELKQKIDWFLEHPTERQHCKETAQAWVRENETYSNRLSYMLKVLDLC